MTSLNWICWEMNSETAFPGLGNTEKKVSSCCERRRKSVIGRNEPHSKNPHDDISVSSVGLLSLLLLLLLLLLDGSEVLGVEDRLGSSHRSSLSETSLGVSDALLRKEGRREASRSQRRDEGLNVNVKRGRLTSMRASLEEQT